MRTFGLLGKSLLHSFSASYFNEKFYKEGIDSEYLSFELENIQDFKTLINEKQLSGLNVTIPYKESIIPFMDELSNEAKIIGAVNTIQFINGKTIGHNTDFIGFLNSIKPLLDGRKSALILGNGGAAKAVKYALDLLSIDFKTVNRNTLFNYSDVSVQTTEYYNIIINTTPLGTHPNTIEFPKIPYENLNSKHLLFDLIYNPSETKFLKYGKAEGATIKNGLEMLQIQAEESWNIWNLQVDKY
jgi:shikimate dehydrogenase